MDRPITPIDEFERALDKAALTKEEYELIDYIRYTSVFTQTSLIKDLKRPSKPPLLSVLCQICRKIVNFTIPKCPILAVSEMAPAKQSSFIFNKYSFLDLVHTQRVNVVHAMDDLLDLVGH